MTDVVDLTAEDANLIRIQDHEVIANLQEEKSHDPRVPFVVPDQDPEVIIVVQEVKFIILELVSSFRCVS